MNINNTFKILAPLSVLAVSAALNTSYADDFADRCSSPNVVRCWGFDTLATTNVSGPISGAGGMKAGSHESQCENGSCRKIDTSVKASGAGSLRFEIPANSSEDSSGAWHGNFADDYSIQFGEGEEFFVQWRQRFTKEMLNTVYAVNSGEGGWKQIIIGEGSRLAPETNWPGGYPAWSSCTKLEVVMQNIGHYGFPRAYHRCGTYQQLTQSYGSYDFKLQNMYDAGATANPRYCLYSNLGGPRPTAGCFPYYPDEWMTFQMRVKVGTWNQANTEADMWVAREGSPSVHIISSKTLNVNQEVAGLSKYGKIWLLPFNTAKKSSVTNPVAYTWYDELIVSRAKIADPIGGVARPNAPSTLRVQ